MKVMQYVMFVWTVAVASLAMVLWALFGNVAALIALLWGVLVTFIWGILLGGTSTGGDRDGGHGYGSGHGGGDDEAGC